MNAGTPLADVEECRVDRLVHHIRFRELPDDLLGPHRRHADVLKWTASSPRDEVSSHVGREQTCNPRKPTVSRNPPLKLSSAATFTFFMT